MEKVVYALHKKEYKEYLNRIHRERECAFDYFFTFLKEKDPREHLSPFSYLSEYFSILYHFENLLENIVLGSDWEETYERWIVDESMALKVVVHVHSLHTCRQELLHHNISLSIH